jgi:hypothetical protein
MMSDPESVARRMIVTPNVMIAVTKVAAYQAPLLPNASTQALSLIADQVRTCE